MHMSGLVFDFDGLIVDTEMPQFIIFQEEFKKLGFAYTYKDWWKIIGSGYGEYNPYEHLASLAGDHHDADNFKKSIDGRIRALLNQAQPLPGVVDFINEARRMRIPMAVASSSPQGWVHGHLKRIGLFSAFDKIITSADVTNVKPDPEIFRLAVESLGLKPDQCVAFEDSLNGIKSAKAAGLYCIAIPNDITRSMPLDLADRIVASFNDLRIEDVLELTNRTKYV